MGISERKARARKDLRQQILETAEELFVRDGYEKVTMRKIAGRIEYSPTTIYHHFTDKGELFACLLEGYQARLLAVIQEINSREEDPLAALKRGMRAYTEFGLANPSS